MKFLLSVKASMDATPEMQSIKDEADTFQMVHKVLQSFKGLDENSADLLAMSVMEDVKNGQPKALQSLDNKRVLVVHILNENKD